MHVLPSISNTTALHQATVLLQQNTANSFLTALFASGLTPFYSTLPSSQRNVRTVNQIMSLSFLDHFAMSSIAFAMRLVLLTKSASPSQPGPAYHATLFLTTLSSPDTAPDWLLCLSLCKHPLSLPGQMHSLSLCWLLLILHISVQVSAPPTNLS